MQTIDSHTSRDEELEQLLIRGAKQGDRAALQELLRLQQPFVYNLAFYMLQNREDAEDATQEILSKVARGLEGFRGDAKLRTWIRRICVHHLLDFRRSRPEEAVMGFECYGEYLEHSPELSPSELHSGVEFSLLVEEARIACTMGMLLCLERELRIAFLLGEVLEVTDQIAAEVLEITRDTFRQRLSRARARLSAFMQGHCGLVNAQNSCRCSKKALAFVNDGIISGSRLQLAKGQLSSAWSRLVEPQPAISEDERKSREKARYLYPLFEPPDLVQRLRALISEGDLSETLGLR